MRTQPFAAAAAAVITAAALALVGEPAAAASGGQGTADAGAAARYVVLGADGASRAAALAAISRAGGRVVAENQDIATFTVESASAGFAAAVGREGTLGGAARDRVIGQLPGAQPAKADVNTEVLAAARAAGQTAAQPTPQADGSEPLADLQWDMRMVKADQAHLTNNGDRRVLVGILDSGIDTSNPDLAANTNLALSRNFVTDIPLIDGPCEFAGCVDPVGWDDNGHGSHVSGIVAAALNGVGIAGVAPGVTLVEVRGGQDSGFVFLDPVINALTYSADIGVDVVNMSFYIDPWLFNCRSNPADSPDAQAEQRAIIEAVGRAMEYAHRKNVTLVDSLGNEHLDHGNPPPDASSPDYPPGTEYTRTIDPDDCDSLPVEGPHSIGVAALGPSGRKADYSNYGLEQNTVSAPGGWFRDGFGTPTYRTFANEVLSSYSKVKLQALGQVNPAGKVLPQFAGLVFRSCTETGECGYYTYLQGTSMAAPHATGVVALIVSRYGHRDPWHANQLTLDPDRVEQILTESAVKTPCRVPVESYANEGRGPAYDAPCVGSLDFNSIYGHGIVDALAVVAGPVGG